MISKDTQVGDKVWAVLNDCVSKVVYRGKAGDSLYCQDAQTLGVWYGDGKNLFTSEEEAAEHAREGLSVKIIVARKKLADLELAMSVLGPKPFVDGGWR